MYILQISKENKSNLYFRGNGKKINLSTKVKDATIFTHLNAASSLSEEIVTKLALSPQMVKIKKINLATMELSNP